MFTDDGDIGYHTIEPSGELVNLTIHNLPVLTFIFSLCIVTKHRTRGPLNMLLDYSEVSLELYHLFYVAATLSQLRIA